jgi:hypothetical protein
MLTVQELAKALPANLKSAATPALLAKVNGIVSDPTLAEQMRENFVSYTHVLADGKYKMDDYINAVMYVSYKLMGHSNQDAYAKTFPQRYATMQAAGRPPKEISAYVSIYNKGKLVNAIMEQSVIPSWVLNQDVYQEAINVQKDLMLNAQSEKVRSDAANSLLTHLARPKEVGPGININLGDKVDGMEDLRRTLMEISGVSRQLIEQGVDIRAIAEHKLVSVDGEVV